MVLHFLARKDYSDWAHVCHSWLYPLVHHPHTLAHTVCVPDTVLGPEEVDRVVWLEMHKGRRFIGLDLRPLFPNLQNCGSFGVNAEGLAWKVGINPGLNTSHVLHKGGHTRWSRAWPWSWTPEFNLSSDILAGSSLTSASSLIHIIEINNHMYPRVNISEGY